MNPGSPDNSSGAGGAPLPLSADARGWNFRQMAVALFVGWLLQELALPCLCSVGDAKMKFALAFDVLVLARTLVAYWRHETGRGWIFYAVLCYTSAGWITGIAYLVLGNH